MLTIRLQRTGRRNKAAFRVVATEHTVGPKSNKHLEVLGNYDPHQNTASLKGDRIVFWISKGAKPSDTVHNLLVTHKVIEGTKRNVLPKKTAPAAPAAPEVKEEKTAPAPAETEPAAA